METATDILMGALEDFGVSEGRDVVLIYSDEAKNIIVRSNCGAATAVGLTEWARQAMIKKMGGT